MISTIQNPIKFFHLFFDGWKQHLKVILQVVNQTMTELEKSDKKHIQEYSSTFSRHCFAAPWSMSLMNIIIDHCPSMLHGIFTYILPEIKPIHVD